MMRNNQDHPAEEEMVHIQFRVSASRADEFNQLVLKQYGIKHGGKTRMFLDLIDEYQKSTKIRHLRAEIERLEREE